MKKQQKLAPEPKKSEKISNYDEFKEFQGEKYTGIKQGRGHVWHYDWEFNYNVNKHRAGKLPEGSDVPIDTEYQWYILTHQKVRKRDANTCSTVMKDFKYKLAHKHTVKTFWNAPYQGQRKRLIKLFQSIVYQLEQEKLQDKEQTKVKKKRNLDLAKS